MQHSTPHEPDAKTRSRRGSPATPVEWPSSFSQDEWALIKALRDCYEHGHDVLSLREQMRLRFLKWLVESDRLEP